MSTKALLQIARDAQALALVGKNMKLVKKKKKRTKDFIKTGVSNVVGIELIKAQADIAAGL